MKDVVSHLLTKSSHPVLTHAGVIPWSCPVLAFGDPTKSFIGTVGLNPSNREFVDAAGDELDNTKRRFETLRSLGLRTWKSARASDIQKIVKSQKAYFLNNPYDGWFKRLDLLISATRASYYCGTASHLDLIPYATFSKWGSLSTYQRRSLIGTAGNALALTVRDSAIKLLVLNGASVVSHFQKMYCLSLYCETAAKWTLRAKSSKPVVGYSYRGEVTALGEIALNRKILVLGFNHNIQSSFGVTREVVKSIQDWIGQMSEAYKIAAT